MSPGQPTPRAGSTEPQSAREASRGGHEHRWRGEGHLDGCHFFETVYACTRCRATASVRYERDFLSHDGASLVWAEPQLREVRRDERGRFVTPRWEEVRCERCEELKAGAPIRRDLVIVGADGQVEREEHTELDAAARRDG